MKKPNTPRLLWTSHEALTSTPLELFGVAPSDVPVPVIMVPLTLIAQGLDQEIHMVAFDAHGLQIEVSVRAVRVGRKSRNGGS